MSRVLPFTRGVVLDRATLDDIRTALEAALRRLDPVADAAAYELVAAALRDIDAAGG